MPNEGEVKATAYHEAGHAVALHFCGRRVNKVVVISNKTGVTDFDAFPVSDDDTALVALAGIQAESNCEDAWSLAVAMGQYLGARGDRGNEGEPSDPIAERLQKIWVSHRSDSLWWQGRYNKALSFVQKQKNAARIAAIANTLLKQKGFPKVVEGDELKKLLGG